MATSKFSREKIRLFLGHYYYYYLHEIKPNNPPVTRWVAFVSVGSECQSGNPFVCFGAKTTQRGCVRDLPRDRKDEGREIPDTVGKTVQSAEGSRRDKSTEQVSQEIRVEQKGDQLTDVRKASAKTC